MPSRKSDKSDLSFEIAFCESVLKREPECLEILEMLAGFYTRVGRIDDGLSLDLRLVMLDPDNATSHYNLACSYALKENRREAVEALREALKRGYGDFDWLLKDKDLKTLHLYPPFLDLLKEYSVDVK
jgi:tetratricopeptide (TPR) repeat protein